MFIMDLGKAFKGQAFTPIEQIVPALKDATEERPKKQDWKRDKANFMRWVEGFKNG